MKDKRGQGLSTNAIILIILGIIVLVVLILGFTMGWDKFAPWLSGGNNVDTIKQQCSVACTTNSVYDYCSVKRELKADNVKIKDATCYYLLEKGIKYGIQKCSSVDCTQSVILDSPCIAGKTLQTFDEKLKAVVHQECK